MIHVLALVELNPGTREQFLNEFAKVAIFVRDEEGCIEYGAAVDSVTDLPVQQKYGEDSVLIVEKWESLAHLKAHLAAPHMSEYRIQIKPFVKSVGLRVLDPRV